MYRTLLLSMINQNYRFQTFQQYLESPASRVIMLRHDVDILKTHSLQFAQIQHELGVVGSYYFRMVPQSFDEAIIRKIADLGHEIGYHYEDMDIAKGDPQKAIELFSKHLEVLRKIVPVKTICMHGSPRSTYDNRDMWDHHHYKSFGILGEPYFDLDFRSVFYITDTGRRWNGHQFSVRDKVKPYFSQTFHKTKEIVAALNAGGLPDQIMFTFHPQRWTNSYPLWLWQTGVQAIKNPAKRFLIKIREARSSDKPVPKIVESSR